MAFKTYYKVNGELSNYPVKKYPYCERNRRPKCDKCGYQLRVIRTLIQFKQTTIGYYCVFCKVGFLDKTTGKFFSCDIDRRRNNK